MKNLLKLKGEKEKKQGVEVGRLVGREVSSPSQSGQLVENVKKNGYWN